MTERKPLGTSFESWIDKQIREATERGEFENLEGAGKPIPGSSDDENWWLKNYLNREGVRADGMLPPSLLLRRDVERLPETVRELDTERQVRAEVAELNRRIIEWLRLPDGPCVPVSPVNADDIVARWCEERAAASVSKREQQPRPESKPPAITPSGWYRLVARIRGRR
ncbi:J-domain-containing protein [Nocardia australiensis]|uniref:DnaJ family domain-containing protein n=1 Tax=Nocardia australiensis TaxID=2887191 RepID=UPI001D145048|nr:DUF1992 domain-containing protein [Nocardia australiensis]